MCWCAIATEKDTFLTLFGLRNLGPLDNFTKGFSPISRARNTRSSLFTARDLCALFTLFRQTWTRQVEHRHSADGGQSFVVATRPEIY